MKLAVTPLRPEHAPRVHAWENHPDVLRWLLHDGVTLDEVAARAASPPTPQPAEVIHHVIERADVPVGYLALSAHPPPPCAWGSFELFVGPEHQGEGVGREALARVPGLLRDWRGLEVIRIGVFEDNHRAVALYKELGYAVTERCWFPKGGAERRGLLMSNNPDAFARRPIGFRSR
ncbi:MAG: hypothetical protein CMH57_10135 [Myxococcales bacterium]|nr:hypothetical protein [Myxococcales bacterium]